MTLIQGNDSEEMRRNPRNVPGKLRGGGGDIVGDEELQAQEWDELVAEGNGEMESRIDDVGNAQDTVLAGTGDLDRVHRPLYDEGKRQKRAAEDSPSIRDTAPGGAHPEVDETSG